MARRKPPERGGLYRFGREIPYEHDYETPAEMVLRLEEISARRGWTGTEGNAFALVEEAEQQAWAILEPTLGVARAKFFVRLPNEEIWRPRDTVPDESPIAGGCWAELLVFAMLGKNPPGRLIWASRLLSIARRMRDALDKSEAGVAASWAYALGSHHEAGLVEFGCARTVSAGRKTVRAARYGGEQRAGKLAPGTKAILAYMRHQIQNGKTVSEAAHNAKGKGLGTSHGANRGLWYEHRDKNL